MGCCIVDMDVEVYGMAPRHRPDTAPRHGAERPCRVVRVPTLVRVPLVRPIAGNAGLLKSESGDGKASPSS